jgi:hypothetical protein
MENQLSDAYPMVRRPRVLRATANHQLGSQVIAGAGADTAAMASGPPAAD